MSEYQGDQGRSETTPYGPGPSSGSSSWGGQGGYQQGQYGQGGYGQGDPYAQAQPYGGYDQAAAYQQGYAPGGYPPPGYGAPAPSKPGTVITAAVFGLIMGAGGVLVTLGLIFGATVAQSFFDAVGGSGELSSDESAALDAGSGAVTGVFVVLGLVALLWTVLIIWGSIWALTGRSRVLLLVAGSISIAATGVAVLLVVIAVGSAPSGLDTSDAAGGVVLYVAAFVVALLTVVLLSTGSSSRYFAAHRARRGR